jgi:CheY-like chemotaxis protein
VIFDKVIASNIAEQTVLIVDDNPVNLAVVVDHLEDHNFNVAIAQGGEEALLRAELVQPDLILLDVMMPGIDGFETCRRLKANPRPEAWIMSASRSRSRSCWRV